MDATIKIINTCKGGGHLTIEVMDIFTNKVTVFVITKEELNSEPEDIEMNTKVILSNFIKESGLINWKTIETTLNTKVFKI